MKMVLVCAVICLIYALTGNVQSRPLPRDLTQTQRYVLEKPNVLSRDLEDGSEKRSTESDSSEESDSSGVKDIDECATNNGNCEQLCSNTVGSFDCSCMAGYVLNADGLSCDDIDECATNNGNCEQLCNNDVGSYDCNCIPGYVLNADELSCDDIDECATNNGSCEQLCNNTVGSYDCNCIEGYVLNADGLSCDALTCFPGWIKNGTSCYLLVEREVTWVAARSACSEMYWAYLAEITSQPELDYLYSAFSYTSGRAWIGLTDRVTEGSFHWDDSGIPISFENWAPNEPYESYKDVRDCVHIGIGSESAAGWITLNCDVDEYTYYFICERPTEPYILRR